MAVSICLFSAISKNPHGFSLWYVLEKLAAITRNNS
jgi:hypothetical protein